MDLGILSVFPSLFDYSFLATAVLRIALGLLLISTGSRMLAREQSPQSDTRALGVSASVIGLALTIGFYTQIAAIFASVLWGVIAFHAPRKTETPVNIRAVYAFLALVSLTLLFFGPGAFAVDLPF